MSQPVRAAKHASTRSEGLTVARVSGWVAAAQRRLGFRGGALVLFGSDAAFPHGTAKPKSLARGDVVLIDGGCYAHFTQRLGHGIGLDGHEWPYMVRGDTTKLAPGTTFTDEPGIYVPGELKKAYADATSAVDVNPLSLRCLLATSIPAPHFHTVRYTGVLAAARAWRPRIAPKPPAEEPATASAQPDRTGPAGGYRPPSRSGPCMTEPATTATAATTGTWPPVGLRTPWHRSPRLAPPDRPCSSAVARATAPGGAIELGPDGGQASGLPRAVVSPLRSSTASRPHERHDRVRVDDRRRVRHEPAEDPHAGGQVPVE